MPSLLDAPVPTTAPTYIEENADRVLLQRPFNRAHITAEFREDRTLAATVGAAALGVWNSFLDGLRSLGASYAETSDRYSSVDRLIYGYALPETQAHRAVRCCNDFPAAR